MHQDNLGTTDSLQTTLDSHTAPTPPALHTQEEALAVRCLSCAHRCLIRPGQRGICRMRYNHNGVLYSPSGYVAALQVDPIEKKPFYHVSPGTGALSFGMLGCNFQCDFCQNWISSQTLRDPNAVAGFQSCATDVIVSSALKHKANAVVSTYNEPLITADWAAQVFEKAKVHQLLCGFVSNGYASKEVLAFMRPVMDICNVDLKCYSEAGYRHLGGRLKPVLDCIETLLASGVWVEVVTLVVPGFNDAPGELEHIATFLAGLSQDVPWHVTAFFPTYKRTECLSTPPELLERAWDAGKEAGLRYVYAGNMAGRMGNRENTYCPNCAALLIQRHGFRVSQNHLTTGTCPHCGTAIAGRWALAQNVTPESAKTDGI